MCTMLYVPVSTRILGIYSISATYVIHTYVPVGARILGLYSISTAYVHNAMRTYIRTCSIRDVQHVRSLRLVQSSLLLNGSADVRLHEHFPSPSILTREEAFFAGRASDDNLLGFMKNRDSESYCTHTSRGLSALSKEPLLIPTFPRNGPFLGCPFNSDELRLSCIFHPNWNKWRKLDSTILEHSAVRQQQGEPVPSK